MSKKVKVCAKSNIYRPKNQVQPMFAENVITDNYTDKYGNVRNRSVENVVLSKREVDANIK